MSLLKALGLKPTQAMLHRAALSAAAEKPTEARDIAVDKPVPVGTPLARKASESDVASDPGKTVDAEKVASAERDQADKLLPALAARRKALADLSKRVEDGQAKVVKLLSTASPDKKKGLEEAGKKLDAALSDAHAKLEQVIADIAAIEDPLTRREELIKVLARGGSKAQLEEITEVEAALGAKGVALNEVKQSSTTTSVKHGVAEVHKEQMSAKVGLDGVTAKKGEETERVWKDGSLKTSSETQVKVGPGGLVVDKTRSTEAEFKGQTAKLEESNSLEVGRQGIKRSQTVKSTLSDGSSREESGASGIERGEGQLGIGKGKTVTTTDAAGQALTKGAKGSGGLVAGDGGLGAYGKAQGEVGTRRRQGFYTGAVGGLHGNVVCNVGDPKGGLYPLTLAVSLGADISLKSGVARKGASGKAGVEVKLGAEVVMTVERHLDEKQLAAYVESLKAASGGGKIAGTALELRVIQAGVKQGWPVAQALWKGGGKPLSKEMVEQLEHAGDSVTLQTTTSRGGKVSGDLKAVSLELGAEQTEEHKTRAARNEAGDLDIEADAAETTQLSGKVGVSYGVVGASVGKTRSFKTSFGYEITVDIKKDVDGNALAELQALAANGTEKAYEAFIARRKDRISVKGRKKGGARADSESLGLSVAGVEASIGLSSGVAQQLKTDGDGKLVESTVVGSARSGGGIKLGDAVIGDSGSDEALARRSGDGDATLDLTHTNKQTSYSKLGKALKSKLPFMGDDEQDKAEGKEKSGKPKGMVAAAAGGEKEAETEVTEIYGLKLSRADLVRIGKIAFTESQWTRAATRKEEYFDWKAIAKTIRDAQGDPGVVADELARFVGGDKIHRAEVLNRLIRPPGRVDIGKAFGFPDSLRGKEADYAELIDKPCEEEVRKLASTLGAQKAGELGKQLFDKVEALRQAWTHAKDFSKEGVRAEMLSAIAHRKTALTEAMREIAGKTSQADKKQAAIEAFGRLNRECYGYSTRQDALFAKVNGLLGGRRFIAVANGDRAEAEAPMRALSDLYAIWQRDLGEAVALAKAYDIPEQRYKDNQPNQKEWERLKKACMMGNY